MIRERARKVAGVTVAARNAGVGELLRGWRALRRVSQLELALQAGVSQRHLSFVEIGRANPSRELVLRLSAELGLALRDRNALLLAAGYAPAYPETPTGGRAPPGPARAGEDPHRP